jgi:hypothetical protein
MLYQIISKIITDLVKHGKKTSKLILNDHVVYDHTRMHHLPPLFLWLNKSWVPDNSLTSLACTHQMVARHPFYKTSGAKQSEIFSYIEARRLFSQMSTTLDRSHRLGSTLWYIGGHWYHTCTQNTRECWSMLISLWDHVIPKNACQI